jgi:hypothetical protein
MKSAVFRDIMPCSLVEVYRRSVFRIEEEAKEKAE